jgi:hypothetical protein
VTGSGLQLHVQLSAPPRHRCCYYRSTLAEIEGVRTLQPWTVEVERCCSELAEEKAAEGVLKAAFLQ